MRRLLAIARMATAFGCRFDKDESATGAPAVRLPLMSPTNNLSTMLWLLAPCAAISCHYTQKMKATQINWTFGNFDITCSIGADVDGPAAEMLLRSAAINILQRGPAGAAEKLIAGYDKRPTGFQRSSIAFTQQAAEKLKAAFTGRFNLNPEGEPAVWMEYACDEVNDHALAQGKQTDTKYVEERKVAGRHATDWPQFMADKIGFKETEVGTFDNPAIPALAAIRAYVKAMTAGI